MHSLFTRIGALQVLGALMFFLRTKTTALVLGPGGVGLVSVIDQYIQLVLQISAFAVPFAAIKALSKAHSENVQSFRTTYAGLLRLLLVQGTLGAVLGMFLIIVRPSWVSISLADHVPLVAVGMLALPAMILHGFFRVVPAAAMKPITSAVWDVITAVIMSSAVITGVLLNGVLGYFVGIVVGCVAVSLSYYFYFSRQFGLSITIPQSIQTLLKAHPSFVKLSFASYAVSFIQPLTLLIVRTMMLDHFGAVTAGLLQSVIGISLAVGLLLNPLNGLLFTPFVNRMVLAAEKHSEAQRFQKKLLLAIAGVALPPILFPDLALMILYSSQFVDAAPVLYWFVLAQVMLQIGGVYTALMIGLDRVKAYAAIMVAGSATNAALAILLIPTYGLFGAGVAGLASASLVALGTFTYLRVREGFRISRSVGFATLFLVAGLGLLGALIGPYSSIGLPNLLMKLIVGAVAFALVVPMSLDRNELQRLADRLGVGYLANVVGRLRWGDAASRKPKDSL